MSRKENRKKQKLSKDAGKSRYTRKQSNEKNKMRDFQNDR